MKNKSRREYVPRDVPGLIMRQPIDFTIVMKMTDRASVLIIFRPRRAADESDFLHSPLLSVDDMRSKQGRAESAKQGTNKWW